MAGGSTAGSLKLNKSSFTLSGVTSNDTLTYTTDGGGSMSTPRVKVSVETVTLVNAAGTVLQDLPIKVADDQVSVTGSYQIPLDLAKSYPSINYANLRVIAHYKQVTQSDMGDTTTYFDYVQNLTIYFTNALYAPTCALTYEEATPGLAEKFGAFIQIYSSVKATPEFTGKYGATLKTGTVTFDGMFKNFSSVDSDILFGNIKTSGNQKLECKVTDSRGNTFTTSYTLNVLAYTIPQLTTVVLDRCDENGEHNDHGRYVLVEAAGSITPLGDKNDKSLIVNYKLPEDAAWASQDISSLFVRYVIDGKAVVGTGDFDPTLTYNFKVSLTDAFNSTEVSKNITTATPLLDFHKSGTGLAIGGAATKEDTFDVLLPNMSAVNLNVEMLEVDDSTVYGVTTNNGWYEEKLGDNFYRWTQIFKVSANIATASGSLYNSDTLTIPAVPTGSANVYRAITILTAPWPCWSGYFATAGGFRLFSTVVRTFGEVTLEAVLYGSKN
ncbi:DUF859 family phage minor structural protein [Lactococcus garvieae]|uniref:DUF859 family phage minor structural protein n=1 Tax=Lactococcus garvieae TaxID=1363 RepID=UPI0018D8935C|nr:DUF859 family phage minor structural protein [Lactococcus garvieae]QPS70419.1 hypothetical protein I6G50_06470 [Lactococcus garvieae]